MLKTVIFSFLLLFIIFPSSKVFAVNEFSSSYEVLYSVSEDGKTDVEQDIKLKNLTDKFFPSSFSLTLPGKGISELQAKDTQGPLEITSAEEGDNTKITIKFINQQIIGLNKEYAFNLKFKSGNIAKKLGAVTSVNIPKVSQNGQVDSYKITLSVPTALGDPDFISPNPVSLNESVGRINFNYQEQASQTGIAAIFGQSLGYSYEAKYSLKNNSIFPKLFSLPVPGDSQYQKSYLNKIEPLPENTVLDEESNIFAVFKVNPGESIKVTMGGELQTFLQSQEKIILDKEKEQSYLSDTKFWDVDNPVITTKLGEILAVQNPQTNIEKAKEIDKFVSNFLQFDTSRLANNDFRRFGSVTGLNNPEKALSAEFVDLEIALLRSAGIPARQIIGFNLPSDNKPFSFNNGSLHTWVEIYDQESGWVTSDPAWENTTKGSRLFNFNDLSHLRLLIFEPDQDIALPNAVEVKLFDGEMVERKAAELDVQADAKILSGFPSKAKIIINNLGNVPFPESELKIDTSKILIESSGETPSITKLIKTSIIPPFGSLEFELNLKTGAIWHSYQDVLQVTLAGVTDTRVVTVEPILSYRIFAVEIAGGFIIIALFYVLVFLVHHRSTRKQ